MKAASILVCAILVGLTGCGSGGGTPTAPVTIGGKVIGLAGTGLVLVDNGGDSLPVGANGGFTFATAIDSGAPYLVTIATQPSAPTQVCVVANGAGTAGAVNVASVTVTCTTSTFTIGGTVTGLAGSGLVLQDSGGADLPLSASGAFTFPAAVASGAAYAVTVKTQPAGPAQTCTISHGSGTVGAANVTDVAVSCQTGVFLIGGTVSGLAGGGLVLRDNGGDDLTITGDGAFAFATPLATGATYAVTVATQPTGPSQTCVVTGGAGTVAAAAVTSVAVTCTTRTFTVGGMVSGLVGGGLVLRDNGGDDLPISANGAFTFATAVASGAAYAVTVASQPAGPSQTCVVTGGSGTIGGVAVTGVAVTCTTDVYAVGGTVSGLVGGGLVLRDNGGDDLAITADGAFTFVTPVASAATYAVTVASQPSGPSQTCTVTGGSGTVTTAAITGVTVTCVTRSYTVGGTVSGLAGTGLVLQDSGGDNLTITGNGAFTFATAVASGAAYAVTVKTQPSGLTQSCVVTAGSGTVTTAAITSVAVACTTSKFTIGVNVTGLAGTGLVLQDNGGDNLAVTASGGASFATTVLSGGAYAVTVLTQPSAVSQTCTVTAGSGTVGGANVTVAVACVTNTYKLSFTVSGLTGTGLDVRNAGNSWGVSSNGTYTYPTPIASGTAYDVSVFAQPKTPTQQCHVQNGSGTITNADVSNVTVTCGWVSLAVGYYHTCATRWDGTLWCWGDNTYGQLGTGTSGYAVVPTQVGSATNWTSVALGAYHSCGIRKDQTLWCWGQNASHQAGVGVGDLPAPVQVPGTWASVSGGFDFTCAIATDGSLWCWGTALGGGAVVATPTQVGTAKTWLSITAGYSHACGLQGPVGAATAWCWGGGTWGAIGDGSLANFAAPLQVGAATTWTSISATEYRTCGLQRVTGGQTLWCWGWNPEGQLGDGTTTAAPTPEQIGTVTSWAVVAAGRTDTCATRVDGTLWCWGYGAYGGLGFPTGLNYLSPVQVGTDTDWAVPALGVEGQHTCATRTDGTPWCWGLNWYGQLGIGSLIDQHTVALVLGF
jgi:alpha-tubulin suppressor-like RCC1 family protein